MIVICVCIAFIYYLNKVIDYCLHSLHYCTEWRVEIGLTILSMLYFMWI